MRAPAPPEEMWDEKNVGQLVAGMRMLSSEGVVLHWTWTHERRLEDLTHARQWLVQRMHEMYFGTMHNLIVCDGEPIVDPPPKTKQAFKLGGKRNAPKVVSRNFVLKEQHIELFDLMDNKQNGIITRLTIQEGLPFLVEWEAD